MKRCPQCSRVYDDENLKFCLDDGTALVNKLPETTAPETAVLPSQDHLPTIEALPPRVSPVQAATSSPATNRRSHLPWLLGAGALLLLLGAGVVVVAFFTLLPKKPLVQHLVLQVAPDTPDRATAVTQSISVIKSRLDALGVPNFEVKPDGDPATGRIRVDLSELTDPERVKSVISNWGKLELVHVISPPSPSVVQTYDTAEEAFASAPNDASSPAQRRVIPYAERSEPDDAAPRSKRWVVIESPAIVSGSDLRQATAARSSGGGMEYEIRFSLKKDGATRFGAWTGANINQYLGVVLNDEVKSIAFIKSQIFDQGVISGRFTKQSAEDLALVLNSGALPARLLFVEEKVDKP
jgi:protein-export membrane protein SecD